MDLFYLLLFIYLVLAVLIIIGFFFLTHRNYLRRVTIDLKPCPFGTETYRELQRFGTNQDREGIISYSLYGNYPKYVINLYKSLDSIPQLLPQWQARVYAANDLPKGIQNELIRKGAEVVIMGPELPKGHEGALWRFLPAKEDLPFVSLDADDVFKQENADSIQKWLNSGKTFCILNKFNFLLPMTAGTWGGLGNSIPDIQERLDKYCEHWFGYDEAFLKKEIWPIVESKGYWSISYYPFKIFISIGIGLLIALILWSLYLAYQNKS